METYNPFLYGLFTFIGNLREDPREAIETEVRYTLTDTLNFAFSVPSIRSFIERAAPEQNVPDVDPLFDEPVIDVDNGISEMATVEIPDGQFIFEIGSPFNVGTKGGFSLLFKKKQAPVSELSSILRNEVDADADDNDAQQLLEEIVTGDSGAVADFERKPGIDGVKLTGLTPDTYTLRFEDNGVYDYLTFAGPGTEAILEEFDQRAPASITDGMNNLSLVDIGEGESVEVGQALNPFSGVLDGPIEDADHVEALVALAKDPVYDHIRLISEDEDSVSVQVDNEMTGETDFLVFFNLPPEDVWVS